MNRIFLVYALSDEYEACISFDRIFHMFRIWIFAPGYGPTCASLKRDYKNKT